jgi:hypothetical protein
LHGPAWAELRRGLSVDQLEHNIGLVVLLAETPAHRTYDRFLVAG